MQKDTDIIKEKVDLVDFLRSYITLHPAGKNFKALCPFHQEKTPSFVVSPERKIWHCFGCGEGGDVLKFAMRYENLEFPEALRFLAERAGIEIRTMNPGARKEFDVLYDIHDAAKEFFKSELKKSAEAQKYLKERSLNNETIEEFNIGFSPGGESLHLHLLKTGYDVNEISKAGLSSKNVRGLYWDRFQKRIIFPISNHLGKTVAFNGRVLPEKEKKENSDIPKYLNSPETPIFNKSKILYGLDKSKMAIAESRSVFLVEGQMDFLMSWQSGVKNVVAVSGTGLTMQHLERLRRLADSVILNFDNDEAGLRALERSLDVFSNFDFHVKVINLGEYKDPAEACEKDPNYLRQATEWAKPAFTHLFNSYFGDKAQAGLGIPEKKRLLNHLLQKIKNLKSSIEQNIWVKELSKISGISEQALVSELNGLSSKKEKSEEVQPKNFVERIDLISERILSIAFLKEGYFDRLKTVSDLFPPVYQSVIQNSGGDKQAMIEMRSSFEFADQNEKSLNDEFLQLLKHLEIEFLTKRRTELKESIRISDKGENESKTNESMNEFQVVSKKIDELKGKA